MDAPHLRLPTFRWGVIDDARRRQHRRRLVVSLTALVAALVAAVIVAERPADEPPAPSAAPSPPPAAPQVPWRSVLDGKPFMGASCSTPNSTSCGRFGVAVWLKRPARAIDATVLDRHIALDNKQWSGPVRNHKRKMFAGFLRGADLGGRLGVPPGVVWEGDPIPYVLVRLRIDYGKGAPVLTQARVPLRPGWG
jgi:hypothetical protein